MEFKILHFLKKNRKEGDVILTGLFHPDGMIGLLSGIPCCFLAHGAELMSGKGFFRKHIWNHYRKIILSKSSKVIANSNYTCNLVKNAALLLTLSYCRWRLIMNTFTQPRTNRMMIFFICVLFPD